MPAQTLITIATDAAGRLQVTAPSDMLPAMVVGVLELAKIGYLQHVAENQGGNHGQQPPRGQTGAGLFVADGSLHIHGLNHK
jgi:hypothetical protein